MSHRQLESLQESAERGAEARAETVPIVAERTISGSVDASSDLLVGRLLRGTYRIISAIDKGGMGRLYRAEHQRLRRPVAVKVMAQCLLDNPEALARFRREAEIVSQLNHPHIVQINDFDTTDRGEPYIVMEFLNGETLARRLDQVRILPLLDAVEVVVQIASGLMLAHRAGVVHRDLKPENVFLLSMQDASIFVKLLDFGISKGSPKSGRVTGKHEILGTPGYMAPEQAMATAKADHHADQWSLACMTYEMLTGHPPFLGDTVGQILSNVISETPPPLTHYVPELPISIQDIVLRGLAKDPFQRYSSIGDFADRLARAVHALASAERLRVEARLQQIPVSEPLALAHGPGHRQRTTKRHRIDPVVASAPPDSAGIFSAVAPRRMSLGRNPPTPNSDQPVATPPKLRPAPARLRSPARGENIAVEPREAKHRTDAEAVQLMLSGIKKAIEEGDEALALVIARASLRLARERASLEVSEVISKATDSILPVLLRALGGPNETISMLRRPSIKDNSMNPTHMFLASIIDGKTTIEELLDISPLSPADTLCLLLDFRDEGFLAC
jgi:serine/threonine protein kinase